MNAIEIIQKYLRENGYDGLCRPDIECGCPTEDICLFSEPSKYCVPAHKGLKDGKDYYYENKKDAEESLKCEQ